MPQDAKSILAVTVWPKGVDYSHEQYLIEKGLLTFNRLGGKNNEFIYLTRSAAVEGYTTAENTTHWYRGMPKNEFDELFKWNMVKDIDNSYTGIAPNREYVKTKFFTNQTQGTHIVEFGNSLQILCDEDFSIYRQFHMRGFSLKAEGGGTFGLGDKGSVSDAHSRAVKGYGTQLARKDKITSSETLDKLKSPSDLFVEWLTSGKIYRKLVDLRVPARSNAKEILEV